MSSTEKIRKLEEKKRSVNFAAKVSSMKLETIGSETCIQPRFASHTLSSLMKTRTPINQKKSSLIREAKVSKRTQKNITYKRQSGVYKRRSISKQNKSMRTLVTILKKREKKDHRTSASHQDSELTGTQGVYECADYSLVFLPSDLTKDVSRDLKKCAASPAKSVSRSKLFPAKIVDQLEKRVQDSHTRLQEKMEHIDSYLSPCLKSNIENIRDNVKDPTVVDIACQLQSSEEEEKFAKSLHREVLHSSSKPAEKLVEDFPNENCSAIEPQIRQNMSTNIKDAPVDLKYVSCIRGNRKTWAIRKTGTRHVNTDHTYNADLQDSQNFKLKYDNSRNKDDRSIVNYATRRDTFQRNIGFINQQVWRPPGITRSSVIKSTISLTQSTSQKWSRSTDRSIASTENKYSSIKHIEMLNSESTSISVNQSKMLMKENQDPCANRATKICEHLIETKQRQREEPSRGTLPKKRRSTTKVNSKTSNNYNNANPTRSRSKSRNRNKQSHTKSIASHSRRSRPLEVIHALKEIINNTRENEDIEENDVNVSNNDVFNNKEDDDTLQVLSIRDVSTKISRDDEAHFNEPNRSFNQLDWKSISTQTEEDLDSTEILKLTQISMQSSNCNNVIEIGCNTTHYNAICKDAEVSCNLIDLTNSETDSTVIEDKTLISKDVSVQTESIMHVESNVEYKYSDKNKQNLNTETTSVSETKLQTYGIMEETSAKMTSFIRDEKEIINENSQTFLLPRNSDDKMNIDTRQAFIKYSNDSVNNLFLEKSQRSSSSIYDYEASCSSEDLVEHLENDTQHGNIVMSELSIPSDVIAAFELAAERARNLRKAIMYYENLISKETEKQKEETEDFETIEKRVSFVNCEVENEKRSECDTKYCRFDAANGKDIDEFSTYSSTSSNSDQMYEAALQKLSLANYCEHVNKKKIKLTELMQGMQEEYALEVLESKENENDDKNCNTTGTIQTLALPMIIEKPSIISCGNLLVLIYCILYSIVFWYLQASF